MGDWRITIVCEDITDKDFDELYHQLALKTSAYPAIMDRERAEGKRMTKKKCDNCEAYNHPGALECSDCGYDFFTETGREK